MDAYIPTLINSTVKFFLERCGYFELELTWTYGDCDILHSPKSLCYNNLDSDGSVGITKDKSYDEIFKIYRNYRNIDAEYRYLYNLEKDANTTYEGHFLVDSGKTNKYLFKEGVRKPRFVKYCTTPQSVRDEYSEASIVTLVTDNFRGIHIGDKWYEECDGFMVVDVYAPSVDDWESFIKDEDLYTIHKKPGFAELLKIRCEYIIVDGDFFTGEGYSEEEGFINF